MDTVMYVTSCAVIESRAWSVVMISIAQEMAGWVGG